MGCPASKDIYPMDGDWRIESSAMNREGGLSRARKDIKIPLTEREIFTITKSWKTINRNMSNTGIAMFLKMFDARSDVKSMFEQFRTVDNMADLWSSRALENHALLVMNALDESITNLDDEEYIIEYLLVTGKSHRRFENFSSSIFWAIEAPFLCAVKQTLGNKYNLQVERIYQKAIRFVLNTLILGFKETEQEDNSIRGHSSMNGIMG